jgi:hypothetical protein
MPPRSIDEVLSRLDRIIADARRTDDPLGYFAALYRDVTARVASTIEDGGFQDGPRMERLDVVFANRYFAALDARGTAAGPPRAWQAAFAAADRWRPLILQHLLLGMNAHINLDLGVAAVETAPASGLQALKPDFMRINQILGAMIEAVQRRLARVSPWIGVLDRLGHGVDEAISNFSLAHARRDAWAFAERLAPLDPRARRQVIAAKDRETARRADAILRPGGLLFVPVLLCIRLRETDDVTAGIDALSRTSPAA